jgi:acyl-coenzyme A thioesterase PaaI-like protein
MDVNDNTAYQRCFACGQQNPLGLKLVFRVEGEAIVADFLPREEYQGFPGVIHGGIIAVVLDEALNRTSLLAKEPLWTMTGRLDIRYRRYCPYGPLLRVRAVFGLQRGRMVQASGKLTLAGDESVVFAEAQGSFMGLDAGALGGLIEDYPEMCLFSENRGE